jgi:hypothetical protein
MVLPKMMTMVMMMMMMMMMMFMVTTMLMSLRASEITTAAHGLTSSPRASGRPTQSLTGSPRA